MHLVLFFYPIHGITVGNQKKITGNENVYSIFVKCHHFYFNSCSQDARYHHPTQYVYELNLIHAETWVVACRYVNEKKKLDTIQDLHKELEIIKTLLGQKAKYTHILWKLDEVYYIYIFVGEEGVHMYVWLSQWLQYFFSHIHCMYYV